MACSVFPRGSPGLFHCNKSTMQLQAGAATRRRVCQVCWRLVGFQVLSERLTNACLPVIPLRSSGMTCLVDVAANVKASCDSKQGQQKNTLSQNSAVSKFAALTHGSATRLRCSR